MKMKTIFKAVTIVACVVLLVSCTLKKRPNGHRRGALGSSTQTAGLGSRDALMEEAAIRKVPHDDTYYFKYDNSRVAPEDLPVIEAQANYLKRHAQAKILLAGNTDSRGSREYNIALGERRARSVANILRLDGAALRQIRILSYGQERPVAFAENEEAYQLNRRVDLSYVVR